jgi:translocation and assembly module TamB
VQDRASTQLPPARRRNRRRDWGRLFARIFSVLLAIVGVLPVAGTLVVRSAWARNWASRETERILRQEGVDARYEVGVRLWPLSIELTNVKILSTDGGAPALVSERISARPKFFALLAGKLVVQEIEAAAPRVRLVMRQGEIANLDVKLKKSDDADKKPIHAPFGVVSVSDASLDLDIDGTKIVAQEVDADVTVDDDRDRGSSFELAVRVAGAQLHRRRVTFPEGDKKPAVVEVDEDALCGVDARVRVEPQTILVRRLEATGSADLDDAESTLPKCDLPADDKRRVEIVLALLRVRLPEK